jgi:hypothetical protein
MLAQIAMKTNARSEWLLCGSGPVFADPNPADGVIAFPPAIKSAFSVLPASLVPAVPQMLAVVPDYAGELPVTAAHEPAARAIVAARGAERSVCVFVGRDALLSGARSVVRELLLKRYATALAMPTSAAILEVPPTNTCDHNHIARLGALAGFGYGEALGRWGELPANSMLVAAQQVGAPVTVHPTFGEIPQHYYAGTHGAELGACIGAVAYVDLLILAEHVRKFSGTPGGVFIALGDGPRAVDLCLHAVATVKAAQPTEHYNNFSFVLIDDVPDEYLAHRVQCAGGQFHFVQGESAAGANALLRACNAVFEGVPIHENSVPGH